MRPSWSKIFLEIVKLVAQRSTCARVKVGAILVKDNRIISMGYNGVPEGKTHCEDYFKAKYENEVQKQNLSWDEYLKSPVFMQEHHEFSIHNEIHAETNALLYAARSQVSTENAYMYISYSPCIHCAKQILQAGIRAVYYSKPYDRDMSGVDFLIDNSIVCQEIK